ncbi:MAG: DUF2520 domain-containing protein [Muribaculaceae bacterium]|nr:DUF2520 domain-containing protein [Muribaculaceae bacterium]
MNDRKIINIIGRGNVGFHLKKAFEGKADVIEVNPHTLGELNPEADLTLISVTDSAIQEVLARLPELKGAVAHTSGSTPIEIFKRSRDQNFGVFYPLQTFSRSKALDYAEIPFYIEASDPYTREKLFQYARLISENVRYADSSQRKRLHIAAVFACNFVNHLWALSDSYLKEGGLNFKDLIPLISETVDKIKVIPPSEAQTGPAVRGDLKMIENHILELGSKDKLINIYRLLSQSILENRK